jgi:SAM-dependent methyltransferase
VATVFLEESIDPARLSATSFASRKVPEFMSHRLVRCPTCSLVYVPLPPAQDTLAAAYHEAAYDSAQEAEDAAACYAQAITPVLRRIAHPRSALEIGTGTGVFLDQLARAGFSELVGVEPSVAAIAAAPPGRRAWIREGIFREVDFDPESFDLVCCFMTMEHVADPAEVAAAAFRLLRPGGAFVTVTHDYRSAVNRVLGRRSPIIDVEHMQLFSDTSLRELFARSGYCDVELRAFVNRYRLDYWLRLTPLPEGAKGVLASLLSHTGLARVKLGVNVGNMLCAGYKPR